MFEKVKLPYFIINVSTIVQTTYPGLPSSSGGGSSSRRITGPHLFCFGAPFVAKIISGGRILSGALIIVSYTDFGGSVGVVYGNYGINL